MESICDSPFCCPLPCPKSASCVVSTSYNYVDQLPAVGVSADNPAYIIFIAQNLQAFVLAVTDCRTYIPTRYMILAELVLFLPIAMIRNLAKLSGTALIADAFILVGCKLDVIIPSGSS